MSATESPADESLPALAAEPVRDTRWRAVDGTLRSGEPGPIEPFAAIVHEQVTRQDGRPLSDFAREVLARVVRRLAEDHRRDIMAGLARAGRRHHGAIL